MSRDRFCLILKFLHLNDNSRCKRKGEPGYDSLFKLRPFLTKLTANFQKCYTLNREVSVDESMVGFKGRLSFIQYMPKKPTKWGLKAFVLSDSKSGYVYNWRLYTGLLHRRLITTYLPKMYYEKFMYVLVCFCVYMCMYVYMHTCVCAYCVKTYVRTLCAYMCKGLCAYIMCVHV